MCCRHLALRSATICDEPCTDAAIRVIRVIRIIRVIRVIRVISGEFITVNEWWRLTGVIDFFNKLILFLR